MRLGKLGYPIIAWLACIAIVLSSMTVPVIAEDSLSTAAPNETTLTTDEADADQGHTCTHAHDESCGYIEASDEIRCDQGCQDIDGDGIVDHSETCAYHPAAIGHPCGHVHDEQCGYDDDRDEPTDADQVIETKGTASFQPALQSKTAADASMDSFTVWDAEQQADARVQVTVTFLNGTTPEALKTGAAQLIVERADSEVGARETLRYLNDVSGAENAMEAAHFYRLSLIDGVGNTLAVDEPVEALVNVEYLRDHLIKEAGKSKLMILDLGESGTTSLTRDSEQSLTEVIIKDGKFSKFSYTTTHLDHVMSFAVLSLSAGYISSISLTNLYDGTEPWDYQDLEDGNDSNANNRRVRSFDSIEYRVKVSGMSRSEQFNITEATIHFEMSMPLGILEAAFKTEDMQWMDPNWSISYLDEQDKIRLIQDQDGLWLVDEDGSKKGKASLNKLVENDGTGYVASVDGHRIVSQRLSCARTMVAQKEGDTVIPGDMEFSVFISALAAKDGTKIKPTIKAWVAGNKSNFGQEARAEESGQLTVAKRENQTMELQEDQVVEVTAKARYNIVVKQNTDASYVGKFDFNTGEESSTGEHGRIMGYGVTLQLYNETDWTDDWLKDYNTNHGYHTKTEVLKGKGLRGIELPANKIDFDLKFTSSLASGSGESIASFTPILWDYFENTDVCVNQGDQKDKGKWMRRMYWNEEPRFSYGKGAAPYNSLSDGNGDRRRSAYQGGVWTVTSYTNQNGTQTGKTDNSSSMNNGAETIYHVSVQGFLFDFENWQFPDGVAGNSGTVGWMDSYRNSFAAGYFQVLQKFPETVSDTTSLELEARADHMQAGTLSNPNAAAGEVDYDKDNYYKNAVAIYGPGTMSKGNAFTKKNSDRYSKDFLGTEYWTRNYDASTFAGDEIALFGYGILDPKSDGYLRSMNLLQKFDSKVLRIIGEPEYIPNEVSGDSDVGQATFLYAADPLFPEGYDSNDTKTRRSGVTAAERMNLAQEEDLIYFKTLRDLEQAGYTCIGVLMEVRQSNIHAGYYLQMKIPMKVAEETTEHSIIGKTVCTTNAVRAWVCPKHEAYTAMDGVSWINGSKNDTVLEGKPYLESFQNELNMPEISNKNSKIFIQTINNPQNGYVKTEYDQNGQIVSGTHKGGCLYGMSLLILGYKTSIDLQAENSYTQTTSGASSGSLTFDASKGHWIADFTVHGIKSEALADTSSLGKTDLTIKVTFSEDSMMLLINHSYLMNGVAISMDEPTEVAFTGRDGKPYSIIVQADPGTNRKEVIFTIKQVPIGIDLPDICFKSSISEKAKNNDSYTVSVEIYGDGDNRERTVENRNKASVGIKITMVGSTSLAKEVSKQLIDLGGDYTYSLRYTNTDSNKMSNPLYLYDLMPYNGDIRSTSMHGGFTVEKIEGQIINNQGEAMDRFTTTARIYYSTIQQEYLRPLIDFKNGTDSSGDDIRQLVKNALVSVDGSGITVYFVYRNDNPDQPVDLYIYNENDVIIGLSDAFRFTDRLASEVEVNTAGGYFLKTIDGDPVTQMPDKLYKLFRFMGRLDETHNAIVNHMPSDPDNPDDASVLTYGNITCLYAIAQDLEGLSTLSLNITLKSADNRAGDVYGNIAHSWIQGSPRGSTLSSNQVMTETVSRDIEGVVWYDRNRNGIRDGNEQRLAGVTVTLFRYDEASQLYQKVEETVTGAAMVNDIETNDSGEYRFSELAAGEYAIAFSGAPLADYSGVTTYQAIAGSRVSNDAVINQKSGKQNEPLFAGIDSTRYAYVIRYNEADASIKLHTIEEIIAQNIPLDRYRERVTDQDMGLIQTGQLQLSKTVKKATFETDESFTFKIDMGFADGEKLSGTYSYTGGLVQEDAGGEQPADGDIEWINGVARISLKANQTITIQGLPAGMQYTVSEEADRQQYHVVEKGHCQGTIIKDDVAVAGFENEYRLGSLSVEKKVANAWTNEDETFTFVMELMLNGQPVNGEFPITGGDPTLTSLIVTDGTSAAFRLKKNQKVVISGLPANAEYTLTETREESFTSDVANGIKTGKITADHEESVVYVNTYKTGSLTIEKTVTNAFTIDENFMFTIKLMWKNQPMTGTFRYSIDGQAAQKLSVTDGISAPIILKRGQKATVSDLPAGATYEVAESGKDYFDAALTNAEGTIMASSVMTVKAENTYQEGDLRVAKRIESDADLDMDQNFTFTISLHVNGKPVSGTFAYTGSILADSGAMAPQNAQVSFDAEGKANISLKHGQMMTIHQVPSGAEYTIREVSIPSGYLATVTSETGTVADAAAPVVFVNRYHADSVSYKPIVEKVVEGNPQTPATFTFNLEATAGNPADGAVLGSSVAEVQGEQQTSFEAITFVKPGQYQFRITEADTGIPGYQYDGSVWMLTVLVEDNGSGKLTIDQNQIRYEKPGQTETEKAVFTNRYQTGELEISKTVTNGMLAEAEAFPFAIRLAKAGQTSIVGSFDYEIYDEWDRVVATGTLSFEPDQAVSVTIKADQRLLIKDLPKGVWYQVEEQVNPDQFDVRVNGAVNNGTSEGILDDAKVALHYQNTHKTGALTIAKTVTNPDMESDLQQEFVFNIALTLNGKPISGTFAETGGGSVAFNQGQATVRLKHGQSMTILGLPAGATYTVSEQIPAQYTVDKEAMTDQIVAGNTVSLMFRNTRLHQDLKISKVVTGTGGDRKHDFTFVIVLNDIDGGALKNSYAYDGSKYGTLKSGDTITLKHGESITIHGVPVGTEYAIREIEANQSGYQTTAVGANGTLVKGKVAEVVFTNHRAAMTQDVPETGDADHPLLWLSLLAVSLIGLSGAFRMRGKRKSRKVGS